MPEEKNQPFIAGNWLAAAVYLITLLAILGFFIQLIRKGGW
jgi:hypothetical protein